MAALGVDIQHTTVAHRESHLVGRDLRTGTPHEEEPLQVCTPPAKWPGEFVILVVEGKDNKIQIDIYYILFSVHFLEDILIDRFLENV